MRVDRLFEAPYRRAETSWLLWFDRSTAIQRGEGEIISPNFPILRIAEQPYSRIGSSSRLESGKGRWGELFVCMFASSNKVGRRSPRGKRRRRKEEKRDLSMQVAVQIGKEHGLGIASRKFCIPRASPVRFIRWEEGDRKRGEEKRERAETRRVYIDIHQCTSMYELLGNWRCISSRFEVFLGIIPVMSMLYCFV